MVCQKCNEQFQRIIWIDGKKRNLQHRKYCFGCSPFGEHNTRKIIDGILITKTCLRCKKTLLNTRRNYCGACRVTRWRQSTKKQLVEYKGGKCIKCGYDKCIDCLAFHHKDPSQKDFSISSNHIRSIARMKKETDKCDLLCHNCHGETHAGLI